MYLKKKIKRIINKLPYFRELYSEGIRYKTNSCFPAGHFYSPIISIDEIKKRETEIWKGVENDTIVGIDFQADAQLRLLKSFEKYYNELPFTPEKQTNTRYYFENGFYSYTDGIVLYAFIREFKPTRIVEIGSGFSSALMLDVNDLFFNHQIELTFIEPFPNRLLFLMSENDKKQVTIFESGVQSVPLEIFKMLRAGDILFVDSSHVVKTGSDVYHVFFNILPVLERGVLIHFHDVFYPFEYPKEWVFGGYNWNENYFLRAFLMYNNCFIIRLFSSYLHSFHSDAFSGMPLCYKQKGGDLWIEKK